MSHEYLHDLEINLVLMIKQKMLRRSEPLPGAGKTSIFNVLTGEQPIISGDSSVKGFNLKTDIVKVGVAWNKFWR